MVVHVGDKLTPALVGGVPGTQGIQGRALRSCVQGINAPVAPVMLVVTLLGGRDGGGGARNGGGLTVAVYKEVRGFKGRETNFSLLRQ